MLHKECSKNVVKKGCHVLEEFFVAFLKRQLLKRFRIIKVSGVGALIIRGASDD